MNWGHSFLHGSSSYQSSEILEKETALGPHTLFSGFCNQRQFVPLLMLITLELNMFMLFRFDLVTFYLCCMYMLVICCR